ncbi:hypothetical protein [Escherichia coli]
MASTNLSEITPRRAAALK